MTSMVGTITQLLAGSSYNIRPTDTSEWVIHNIYIHNANTTSVEIYKWDSISTTPSLLMFKESSSIRGEWHVNSTHFITIKNIGATDIYIGYDGIITKSV